MLTEEASDEPLCRVCHDNLITPEGSDWVCPCLCDGSVRCVHRRCLNRWRLQGTSRADRWSNCEVCHYTFQYDMDPVPRRKAVAGLYCEGILFSLFVAAAAFLSALIVEPWMAGALATGSLLFPWAFWDFGHYGIRVFKSVTSSSRRAARTAVLAGRAQRRGALQAERAALSIAQLERRIPQLDSDRSRGDPEVDSGPSPHGDVELQQRISVQSDSDVVHPALATPSGTLTRPGQTMPLGPEPPPPLPRRVDNGLSSRCRPKKTLHRILGVAGTIAYLHLAHLLFTRSETYVAVAIGLTSLGVGYGLLAFTFRLILELQGPSDWTLRRGSDGFFLVRSVPDDERHLLREPSK